MSKPKQPTPEDAYTGVTPGWQSGVGGSFPVAERDRPRAPHTDSEGEAKDADEKGAGARRPTRKGRGTPA